MKQRKKGTVIIERDHAILVTNLEHKRYLLPGGGVEGRESRLRAAIRELKEETGLDAESAVLLFEFTGRAHYKAGFQDIHNVYLVRAFGTPGRKTAWYRSGDDLDLASSTHAIIKHYYEWKAQHADLAQLFQTYTPGISSASADDADDDQDPIE